MSTLEIYNEGESIKIETGDTTTASDVIDILNEKWPGCVELIEQAAASTATPVVDVTSLLKELCRMTQRTNHSRELMAGLESLNSVIEDKRRKQKAIDRIAWEGERRQRYQKGVHFK